MKKIAVIGSSGGHLFVLGGKDPAGLLDEIIRQAGAAQMEVSQAVFVAASKPLENPAPETPAALWVLQDGKPAVVFNGTLAEVNEQAKAPLAELAAGIRAGQVDGLVLVSADPQGADQEVLAAAAESKIPVAGTGGSSMAAARTLGANVISASGTTGTTNRTRAVGYISAFAGEWKLR